MKRKNEKGAITLFVLIAGLSFIAFLTTMLAIVAVRRQAQIETTRQAKEIYSRGDANSIYEEYFIREGAIPIYTPAQLNEMCTGHEVAINEEGGKIYKFSSDAVYVLMNNLAFESEGFWQMPQFTENGRFEGNGKIIRFKNTSNNKECYYSNENNYKTAIFPVEVTFDANGGTVATASKNVKHGLNYGDLPTPTKEGYTFAGWNGKNLFNLSGRTVRNPGGTANSISKRNFNGNGIYVGITADNYYYSDHINSYNVDNNSNSVMVNATSGGYGIGFDIRVLPNKSYTISIANNSQLSIRIGQYRQDGSHISWICEYNKTLSFTTESDAYWLLIVVGADYSYNQSYTNYNIQLEEGTTATSYEAYYVTSSTIVTQMINHTLTARWNANTYTVTFDANGGNVGTASKTVAYGGTYGDLPTPTKTGYTFAGWNGKNLFNLDVAESQPSSTSAEYTIKRTFEFNTYVIGLAYDNYFRPSNVGNVQINSNTLQFEASYGYGVGFPIQGKTNTNYTLQYTGNASNSQIVESSIMFYQQDGSLINYIKTEGNGYKTVNFTTPNDLYYLVIAFCTEGKNTQAIIQNIQLEESTTATAYEPYYVANDTRVTQIGNHTLTARWIPNTYTITYVGNTNTGGSTVTSTHTYDKPRAITTNGFTKTGYSFLGWALSEKINDNGAYTESQAIDASTDKVFVEYRIDGPFIPGEVYQLDVDAKGTGILWNFFYGDSNYLQVTSWTSSNGNSGSAVDGRNIIPLTENYTHYMVRFALGSTGDGNVTKKLLFRGNPGCSATIKNIKLTKISTKSINYTDGQIVNNLTTSGNVNLYAMWTNNNLLYGMEDIPETTSTFMKYSISNGVVTVTALVDDGFGFTTGRVNLEANKTYVFNCTTNGGTWPYDTEAFLMLDGIYSTIYHMATKTNYEFTPTVSGTYWLRLDVNQNGSTYTFSNITIQEK